MFVCTTNAYSNQTSTGDIQLLYSQKFKTELKTYESIKHLLSDEQRVCLEKL